MPKAGMCILKKTEYSINEIVFLVLIPNIYIFMDLLLYRTEPILPYADWPVSSLASVSHWFDIILTIHMSKHMRFFFF